MEENKEINQNSFLPETFVIGFITLLGYALAIIYEYSYSSYFGIPYYFIDIRPTNIFIAIFFLSCFLFSIRNIAEIFETSGLIKDTAIGRFRVRHLFTILLILPIHISYFMGNGYRGLLSIGVYIALVILFEIISTFVYGKGLPSWKEKRKKLEHEWSLGFQDEKEPILTNRFFGRLIYLDKGVPLRVLFNTLMLCVVVFGLGKLIATREKEFYVLSTSPERIVIRQYNDSIFTVSVDKNSKILGNDIRMIEKDELFNNKIDLVLEKIGPLKRIDNK